MFILELLFMFVYLDSHIYVYMFAFICLYLTLLKQCICKHTLAAKEFRKNMFNGLDYLIEDCGH